MLKSYQAVYADGVLRWLDEAPQVQSGRVIVTFIDDAPITDSNRRRAIELDRSTRAELPSTRRAFDED